MTDAEAFGQFIMGMHLPKWDDPNAGAFVVAPQFVTGLFRSLFYGYVHRYSVAQSFKRMRAAGMRNAAVRRYRERAFDELWEQRGLTGESGHGS
jgi:hypothetical protein